VQVGIATDHGGFELKAGARPDRLPDVERQIVRNVAT
jgi:hypothetical protein